MSVAQYSFMQRSLSTLLHAQRAALKAEWNWRLMAEPPPSPPPANPHVLSYLMDETLAQLERLIQLRPTSRWSLLYKTHLAPLYTLCPCGLNPLLAYFAAGSEALREILSAANRLSADEKTRIETVWHFIAQSEIQALCGPCHKICAPALSFPMMRQPDPVAPGHRGRAPRIGLKPVAC